VAALLTDESDASELVAATMQIALEPHTGIPPLGEVRLHLLRQLYGLTTGWPGTGHGLLSMLPLPHRAFHALTQVGGLTHVQVAAVCHVDVSTVRAGCAAARSILADRHRPAGHRSDEAHVPERSLDHGSGPAADPLRVAQQGRDLDQRAAGFPDA
jgi:hypothetical protein